MTEGELYGMEQGFDLIHYMNNDLVDHDMVEYEIKDSGIISSIFSRENNFYYFIFDHFINESCEDL